MPKNRTLRRERDDDRRDKDRLRAKNRVLERDVGKGKNKTRGGGGRTVHARREAESRNQLRANGRGVRGDRINVSSMVSDPTMALDPAVQDYVSSLADPRAYQGVKVPFHINNRPTKKSTTFTDAGIFAVTVALNTSTDIQIYPGHFGQIAGNVNDSESQAMETAYISAGAGPTNFNAGPSIDGGAVAPMLALETGGLALGGAASVVNTAATTVHAPNITFPITSVVGDAAILRWRLVSCQITVTNVTVFRDRGGSIVSCIPPSHCRSVDFPSQNSFSNFPAFKLWGTQIEDCDSEEGDEMGSPGQHTLTWTPRGEDLSFWYSGTSAAMTTPDLSGLRIWLNADALLAQKYEISITRNWEIAGVAAVALTTPAVNIPMSADYIIQALAMLHDSGASSEHMPEVTLVSKASSDTGFNQYLQQAMGLLADNQFASSVGGLVRSILPMDLGAAVQSTLGLL